MMHSARFVRLFRFGGTPRWNSWYVPHGILCVLISAPGLTGQTASSGNAFATAKVSVSQPLRTAASPANAAVAASDIGHRSSRPDGEGLGALDSGYRASSPHWPHIRTMMTDFYYKWTPAERAWAGAHYDYAMSGDRAAWKSVNPTVQHYQYLLLQGLVIPRNGGKGSVQTAPYDDMQRWYSAHPQYRIESAFLHKAGAPADSAHRLLPFGWDTYTWIINPADSGVVAYSIDRFRRLAATDDGLFIDSQGSGDLQKNLKGAAEYPADAKWPPQEGAYSTAYAKLLGALKKVLGPKVLMLNTSVYRFPPDFAALMAAGATHLEKANNPLSSDLPGTWAWIDKLLNAGVYVDLVDAHDYADMKGVVSKHYGPTPDSAYHLVKLSELASYYMVVPSSPDRIALQLVNMWDRPYSSLWLKAQEANIGHPTGARSTMTEGIPASDPVGQKVQVFRRDFDRALVLFRPQVGWGSQVYGDTTAISVPLPGNEEWLRLNADGSVSRPVTSIELGNAQGVILIKRRPAS